MDATTTETKKKQLKTRQQQCQQHSVAAIQLFFLLFCIYFLSLLSFTFQFFPFVVISHSFTSMLSCVFSFASSITMLFCVFGNFCRWEWSNASMAKTAAQTRRSSIVFHSSRCSSKRRERRMRKFKNVKKSFFVCSRIFLAVAVWSLLKPISASNSTDR